MADDVLGVVWESIDARHCHCAVVFAGGTVSAPAIIEGVPVPRSRMRLFAAPGLPRVLITGVTSGALIRLAPEVGLQLLRTGHGSVPACLEALGTLEQILDKDPRVVFVTPVLAIPKNPEDAMSVFEERNQP